MREATRLDCRYMELDSATARREAHKFYRRNGMDDIGLHFSIPVPGVEPWSPSIS